MARSRKPLLKSGPRLSVQASSVTAILLLLALPLLATQANYRLCFPQVVGLPVLNPPQTDPCTGQPIVSSQAPIIDGCIDGDPGWTGAWRYVFGNGTNGPGCTSGTPCSPNAAVQGIKDNTFLYLSLEVNHGQTYDDKDLVVLTFSPTGNPADDRRIHIYPNNRCVSPYTGCSAPKARGSAPRLVEYWTDSSTWNTTTNPACIANPCDPNVTDCVPPNGTLPPTFDVKVMDLGANNSNNVSWIVEVKIPLADFKIPATGNFGFYFDVFRVNGNNNIATEYYWPPLKANGQTNGIGCAVETNTPPPSDWGNGTVDPTAACNGVSLGWTDITSNHSQYQIDATCVPGPPPNCNNSNTFYATPHNDSIGYNPVTNTWGPVPANQVTAIFSIANFGFPSSWTPVPVGNPLGGAGPIDLTASCGTSANPACPILQTSPPWDITNSGDIAKYKANPDQCILVDLDSLAFGVTFINKSVKRNMWVLTASQVSKTAEISAKGYAPHLAHKTEQEFILHVISRPEVLGPNQQPLSRTATGPGTAGTRGRKKGEVTSRLTWVVGGCRLTGQYVVIKGTRYEICDDVGAFGAVVEHFGASAVARWRASLKAIPELTRVKNAKDTYRLRVQQDATKTVTVQFAPEERKVAVFFDAGAGIPHGTFSNAFNTGFSLNAGLEYIATSHFSAEGIFGYHRFTAKVGSGALDLFQFSANGKAYLTSGGSFRPFINAGIGGYDFTPGGNTYFGGNVGAGVLREVNSHWGLQASYNFHAVNTPVTATKFSTLQGGIRFVF